jgi:nucleoside-diphosphate-sugar epimerase
MALNGRRVLVTGASGFLGGALARALADAGAAVRGLVRLPSRAGYIADYPNIDLATGDLADADSLVRALDGADTVFHVAAALGGAPEKQHRVNVGGTRALARLAAEAGVRRFVHISSVAVYGFAGLPDRVIEETPPSPAAYAYSATKLGAEHALREVAAETGLGFSIIRPGMIYGPRSNPWTVQMFRLSRRWGTPFIGDGRGHAMPVHIDDVCELTMLLADHPAAAGEAFNCTPDPGVSWRDFLSAYAALKGRARWLGIPPVTVRALAPVIATLAPRGSLMKDFRDLLPLNMRPVTYSMDKARTLLGWQPQVAFADGIQSCVPYLKDIGLL